MRLNTSALLNRDIHLIRLILIWAPLLTLAVSWVWATVDFLIEHPVSPLNYSFWDQIGAMTLALLGVSAICVALTAFGWYLVVAGRAFKAWRANSVLGDCCIFGNNKV